MRGPESFGKCKQDARRRPGQPVRALGRERRGRSPGLQQGRRGHDLPPRTLSFMHASQFPRLPRPIQHPPPYLTTWGPGSPFPSSSNLEPTPTPPPRPLHQTTSNIPACSSPPRPDPFLRGASARRVPRSGERAELERTPSICSASQYIKAQGHAATQAYLRVYVFAPRHADQWLEEGSEEVSLD